MLSIVSVANFPPFTRSLPLLSFLPLPDRRQRDTAPYHTYTSPHSVILRMGKPQRPKGPEVGLVFPTDKKGGRYV